MLKNKRKILSIIAIIFAMTMFISYNVFFRTTNVQATSRYGSTGSEVTQIQTKLKRWGYYKGAVDGVYGSKTLAAVKWFQSKNGLTADGIAGTKTLRAMGGMYRWHIPPHPLCYAVCYMQSCGSSSRTFLRWRQSRSRYVPSTIL